MSPKLAVITSAVVAFLGVSALAVDVKETARLTVVGPQQSFVITDLPLLALSNVFMGSFIGDPSPEPNSEWPRYTIIFDVQTLDGIKERAYVVQYCVSPSTWEGFVYLPGRGEDSYRRNVSTIIRDDQDGKWHRASGPWSAALNTHISRSARPSRLRPHLQLPPKG
jgi:hypothetical protein